MKKVGFLLIAVLATGWLTSATNGHAQTSELRIEAVRPASVPVTQHTVVDIIGAGFTPGMTVSFNEFWAWRTEYVSATLLRAITPVSLSPGPAVLKIREGKELLVPPQPRNVFTFEPDFIYEKILEARRFENTGNLAQAEASYHAILSVGIKDDDVRSFVLGSLGRVLFFQGRLQEAEQLARQARQLYWRYDSNHALLAEVLYRQGRISAARQALADAGAQRARPGSEVGHAHIRALYGLWLEEMGDRRELGLRILAELRESFPNDAYLLAVTGILKARYGRPAEGLPDLEQAVVKAPWFREPEFRAWLGEVYQRRGQPGDDALARREWHEAARLDPNLPTYYFNIGSGLWDLGRYDRARSLLEQALAMGPSAELAGRARDILANWTEW